MNKTDWVREWYEASSCLYMAIFFVFISLAIIPSAFGEDYSYWHLLWTMPLVLSVIIGLGSIGGWYFRRWKNKEREKKKSMSAEELKKHEAHVGSDDDQMVAICLLLFLFGGLLVASITSCTI